jgi:MSHA biogenesis protein MshP
MNHSNCSRRNPELGAWISELGTRNPEPESREAGFSIITAVFLLVVLSLLGVFIVSVTGLQQSSLQLDVQGVRAYQAARAGIEWGAWQALDPNNTINAASCAAPDMPVCLGTGGTTDLAAGSLAGSLSPFTITVECTRTTTTEGNRNIWVYQLVATACNQPTGGRCPNTVTPAPGYVDRRITAVLSKCKDPTATAPRCACG